MVRSIPYLLAGIGVGAGIMWGLRGTPAPSAPIPVPPPTKLQCDDSELKKAQERVTQLEAELASVRNAPGPTALPALEPTTEESDDTLSWRVSAVEKFVPLNEEQKERLREKYAKEKRGEDAESLDEIVGEEGAKYYREQVQAAFKRVQDEEVDRDVVWLSRKLSLSQEQEASVRGILTSVEAEVSKGRSHVSSGSTPQERVRAMIAENRQRSELRNEQLKKVLTPDQFQAYLASEAESAAADVEVFHDPGASPVTPAP